MATETGPSPGPSQSGARQRVIDGLKRLQEAFPLEVRIEQASEPERAAYADLLRHWIGGLAPDHDIAAPDALTALLKLDAVVLHPKGVSCYPFSARPTDMRVAFGNRAVHAMCAVDALAMARLLGQSCDIASRCAGCGNALAVHVNDDGSLDHAQAERAMVWWKPLPDGTGHCAEGLCRNIRFLCLACSATPAELYTLPEASAIGNAFFGFQRRLLAAA